MRTHDTQDQRSIVPRLLSWVKAPTQAPLRKADPGTVQSEHTSHNMCAMKAIRRQGYTRKQQAIAERTDGNPSVDLARDEANMCSMDRSIHGPLSP